MLKRTYGKWELEPGGEDHMFFFFPTETVVAWLEMPFILVGVYF